LRRNTASYIHVLELAPRFIAGDRALVLGVGAGVLPVILERHYGMTVDSVDINAAVVDAARRYFDFATRGRTSVEDGRLAVRGAPSQAYDVVALDAFNGEGAAPHLVTREFFAEVRRILRPRGLLAVNMLCLFRRSSGISDDGRAFYATLRAEFPRVRVFTLPASLDPIPPDPALQSVLFFASAEELMLRPGIPPRAESTVDILYALANELPPAALQGGVVLRDDHNPFDRLNAATARFWRKSMIREAVALF